jgi:hypothetical protein
LTAATIDMAAVARICARSSILFVLEVVVA